jgi:hypothetical protein
MTGNFITDGSQISAAFDRTPIVLDEKLIELLREVDPKTKRSSKYAQIAASIREIGIIEPPIIVRHPSNRGKYLLLDGRLRLDILRSHGVVEVTCLLATDDEAFTYNKRISRLAAVQEHRMILKLIERNVPAARIARSLNIDVSTLQGKARMLNGVCPEAIEILSDKVIAAKVFAILRCMRPLRQIQAAELMVAMNRYTEGYVRALLAATPRALVVVEAKPRGEKGLTDEQKALMERESSQLDREVKIAHKSYAADHLLLVVARGYLVRILENERIFRYLDQHRSEFLAEFRRIAENEAFAA